MATASLAQKFVAAVAIVEKLTNSPRGSIPFTQAQAELFQTISKQLEKGSPNFTELKQQYIQLVLNILKVAGEELKKQLSEWEGRAAVYEHAIIKFRQKTADLNEEVQTLRDELARMREEEMAKARAAGAEISLLAIVNRQFSEIVEAELMLNAIELKSARFHIKNLRRFMPDNFSKAGGDNDCLIMCVLFPRLSEKASALAHCIQFCTNSLCDNDCLIMCVLFPRLSEKASALAQLLQHELIDVFILNHIKYWIFYRIER